jgi:uncharacterized lipoprotein YmbA
LAWLAAALPLWGCGSYPLPKVYLLGDPAPAVAGVSSTKGLPVIELKTVQVPDNLDTSDIVRLAGANQFTASAKGRWGERLSVGITQDLVATLSTQLPQAVIENRGAYEPTRRLLVTVSRFDISPDGRCVLSARWRLTDAAGKVLSDSDEATFIEMAASGSDAAAAAAMTVALDHLATRIGMTVGGALAQPSAG